MKGSVEGQRGRVRRRQVSQHFGKRWWGGETQDTAAESDNQLGRGSRFEKVAPATRLGGPAAQEAALQRGAPLHNSPSAPTLPHNGRAFLLQRVPPPKPALKRPAHRTPATPRPLRRSHGRLRAETAARLLVTDLQSCLRELRANDGARNLDTHPRRTFPSCSAPSETWSAPGLPAGLSLVRLGEGGGGETKSRRVSSGVGLSVFPQLRGAAPSSHFPPVTGRSARGRKGRNFFNLWAKLPAEAETAQSLIIAIILSIILFTSTFLCCGSVLCWENSF